LSIILYPKLSILFTIYQLIVLRSMHTRRRTTYAVD
jgi:hypothetical protein